MKANEPQLEILLKGWETTQALAKGNGETAWHVRAWGASVWAALLAYAYENGTPEVVIVSIMLLLVVFFIEAAAKQVQYKFIERSLDIERSLYTVLTGGDLRLPENGISTNIDVPTTADLLALLKPQRWLFWFPYLVLVAFSCFALRELS